MQMIVIVAFMLVLPIISIVQDVATGTTELIASIGKWFVFWGVGWRLVAAGGHQLIRPSFTAKDIFEIKDPDATKLVFEIGFGNLALGIPAIASAYVPEWVPALALAGAIFYSLAGIQHIRNKASTRGEVAAMVSNIGLAAVLIFYLLWLFLLA